MPDQYLIEADSTVPLKNVAITEPTTVCLHAVELVQRLPNLRLLAEQRILIFGAGSVDILTALILRHKGAADITISESNPLRRRSAQHAYGVRVIDPLATAPDERDYHTVFDAVDSTLTRGVSTASVKYAGVIIHIGPQNAAGEFDARRITLGAILFAGVYTYTMAEFERALDLLSGDELGDFAWMY